MVTTVNLHEAKPNLSRLVDQAARGPEFIIAKAGKPEVRVVPRPPLDGRRALGGLAGAYALLPAEIKAGFEQDIAPVFGGTP